MLWEAKARVLIDFSVGAGMMVKSALTQGIKVLGVCHNNAHCKTVRRIIREFIVESIKTGQHNFAPADKEARLQALKPARLVVYEQQDRVAMEFPNDLHQPPSPTPGPGLSIGANLGAIRAHSGRRIWGDISSKSPCSRKLGRHSGY